MSFATNRGAHNGCLWVLWGFKCFRGGGKEGFSRTQGDGCAPQRLWVKPQRGRPQASLVYSQSESVSKWCVGEWVRKVLGGEAELQPKPREYSFIAVDGCVVKCRGQPLYVWVGVDAVTRQPIWLGVSLTRTTANVLRFLRRLRGGGAYTGGDPVILTDRIGSSGDHGSVRV